MVSTKRTISVIITWICLITTIIKKTSSRACYMPYPYYYEYIPEYPPHYILVEEGEASKEIFLINGTLYYVNKSTTTSTDRNMGQERETRSCDIWCWVRRVGLFVVQQLLTDEGVNINTNLPASFVLFISLWAVAHQASISVMYAHDKLSDMAAQQCFLEMYPIGRKVEIQESDEPCIIFCLFRKIGIMNSDGQINIDAYKKRIQLANKADVRNALFDYRRSCIETADASNHKQDVCRKAKVFNDCTHLYKMLRNKY